MERTKSSDASQIKSIIRCDISTQNSSVVLIKDVLRNLKSPSYVSSIRALGFDLNSFNKLLNGTHSVWATKPIYEGYFPPEKCIEHISTRNGTTSDGKIFEATLVTETSEASTMKVRPPKPQYIGFEAIFMQEGSVTYTVLEDFNKTENIYTTKGTLIVLTLGDLLLIPRGVARQISYITPGSKYLYIGDPWSDNDLPLEIIRRV